MANFWKGTNEAKRLTCAPEKKQKAITYISPWVERVFPKKGSGKKNKSSGI